MRTSGGQTIVMDANDGSITLSGVTLTLNASSICIGDAPTDRVVLGDKLMALFNSHVHPVGTGTTGSPRDADEHRAALGGRNGRVMAREFLGTGWRFPLLPDASGSLGYVVGRRKRRAVAAHPAA